MNLIVGLFPQRAATCSTAASATRRQPSIGYVTQADNLYPWRTLRQNVEFPLELRMVGKGSGGSAPND